MVLWSLKLLILKASFQQLKTFLKLVGKGMECLDVMIVATRDREYLCNSATVTKMMFVSLVISSWIIHAFAIQSRINWYTKKGKKWLWGMYTSSMETAFNDHRGTDWKSPSPYFIFTLLPVPFLLSFLFTWDYCAIGGRYQYFSQSFWGIVRWTSVYLRLFGRNSGLDY